MADAGDSMDDANFEESNANAAILRLTKELTWVEEVMDNLDTFRTGNAREAMGSLGTNFFDRVFENEINIAVEKCTRAFENMLFRDALKFGCFDLSNARDIYRYKN